MAPPSCENSQLFFFFSNESFPWINIFSHFMMVFLILNLTCIKTSQSYHTLSELWLVDFWWSLYGLSSLAKCVFEKFLSEYQFSVRKAELNYPRHTIHQTLVYIFKRAELMPVSVLGIFHPFFAKLLNFCEKGGEVGILVKYLTVSTIHVMVRQSDNREIRSYLYLSVQSTIIINI